MARKKATPYLGDTVDNLRLAHDLCNMRRGARV